MVPSREEIFRKMALVNYLADLEHEHTADMVDTLLKYGGKEAVEQCDVLFVRPVLIWAVKTGNLAIVKRVLAEKSGVDSTDSDGRTPLMFAAFGSFEEGSFADIFQVLLKSGARTTCVDKYGRTALDYALMTRRKSDFVLNRLFADFANEYRYREEIERWQKRAGMLK